MAEKTYNLDSESKMESVVANYIANKPRELRYAVNYYVNLGDGDVDGIEPSELKKFTNEQLEMLRVIDKKSKEEDLPFGEILEEHDYENFDFLKACLETDYSTLEIKDIDLDNPYSVYKFKIAIFWYGIDCKPQINEIEIELTDEEYKNLLMWKIFNKNSGFNYLRHSEPYLFNKLSNRFEDGFSCDYGPTLYAPLYAIEMTEVEDDAKIILEEQNLII